MIPAISCPVCPRIARHGDVGVQRAAGGRDRVSPSRVPSWRARGPQAQGPLEGIKQIAINESMRLDAHVDKTSSWLASLRQ